MKYWRVTFWMPGGRLRHVWARDFADRRRFVRFEVVDKVGNETEPREVVLAAWPDIVRLRPARMNPKYAELEVLQ